MCLLISLYSSYRDCDFAYKMKLFPTYKHHNMRIAPFSLLAALQHAISHRGQLLRLSIYRLYRLYSRIREHVANYNAGMCCQYMYGFVKRTVHSDVITQSRMPKSLGTAYVRL